MKSGFSKALLLGATVASLGLTAPASARPGYDEPRRDPGHGKCLRFNKTTGAIAGAAGGALIGRVLGGDGTGALIGAAGGALAGHELAHNGRKRCRR